MWVLINESDEESTYGLLPGQELIVGRLQSDIRVQQDTSISRKHAKIIVSAAGRDGRGEDEESYHPGLGKGPQRPTVTIQDLGSTFGTYVGDKAVASSANGSQDERIVTSVELTDGIKIRFGLHSTIFSLSWRRYVCTSSSLRDKSDLKSALKAVDGELVSEWRDDVTHVVMNEIILTIKVVNALAKCVPIVTPAFFADLLTCARTRQPLPMAANYLPRLREHLINASEVSCAVDEKRRSLLQNFTIVFRDAAQMSKFETAIRYCGGMCLAYDGSGAAVSVSDVRHDGYVVISPPKAETARNHKFADLANALLRKGMALIPEQNIGTAILKVCTDVDLNPRKADLILPVATTVTTPSQLLESHSLLASETLPLPSPSPAPAQSTSHVSETLSLRSQKVQKPANGRLDAETADTCRMQPPRTVVKKEHEEAETVAVLDQRTTRKRAPESSTGGTPAKRAPKQQPIFQYLVPESSQGSQTKRQTRAAAKRPPSPSVEAPVSTTPVPPTVPTVREEIPKKRAKTNTPKKKTVDLEEVTGQNKTRAITPTKKTVDLQDKADQSVDNHSVADLEERDCKPDKSTHNNTSGFVTKATFKKSNNSTCDIPLEELTRSYCEMALKPLVVASRSSGAAPAVPQQQVNFKRFKKQVLASGSSSPRNAVNLTVTRLSVLPESSARPSSSTSLVSWMSGVSKSNVNAGRATTSTTINFSDDEEDLADDDIVSSRVNKDEDDDDMWNFEKS